VTVIDGSADSVIATVIAGNCPCAVCYNPISNRVYCANMSSSNVTVIDGASNDVITTMAVGARPQVLCCDTSYNYIYCANHSDNTVTVLDGASNVRDTTLGVGVNPGALVSVPATGRVYVANYRSSSISVLRDTNHSGVEERYANWRRGGVAAIIRGVLFLDGLGTRSELPGNSVMSRAALLDINGRKVMELHSGANDVSRLSPGVYFVREAQAQAQAQTVRKVIVTR